MAYCGTLPVSLRLARSAAFGVISFAAASAQALSVDLTDPGPSLVGAAHTFTATVTDAAGTVQYQWKFSESDELHPGSADMASTFAEPGHFSISVEVTDASGATASDSLQHLAHLPLTPNRPTSSTSIIYDAARNRVYSVNQDNDTVTSIDPDQLTKVSEVAVYRKPEALALAPDGKLWVVHQDDYAIAVIDLTQFTIERGFRLPYASQPVGLAMSPSGDAAYVSLMALGKLLKLDPKTGAVLAEADVGPKPRGVAVSHDGAQVYVTRFISQDAGGEVVKVDAATMQTSARILLKLDNETPYSSTEGRGLPNHLFSIGLSPDGTQAWVPSKKDNIVRGLLRDGEKSAPDQLVRPLVSIIDVATSQEIYARRVDLDDRSPPLHVEFTPYGDLAILALGGTNHIEVRSLFDPEKVFTTILEAGSFPRATVLTPSGRLFVQAWLSREVIAYDMSATLKRYSKATPIELGRIMSVGSEKLPAQVLLGKKVFHDSADRRMSNEGYVTCGACHFEGTDDGRVYDFSDRGEGLRNTLSLLGRAGTKQGPLNWTGNLDEIQDFEHQIRELFSGKGFIPDEVFHSGTKDQPLGEPKAGLSPELDALAAYVSSLEGVNPSPYRNPDGTLTAAAVVGSGLFRRLGCDFCHSGAAQTDSAPGLLHDVGTLNPNSGLRAGAPLLGLDTPTLLGVWETPPYLHDGSAATLRDVLTTSNATGLHGYVAALAPEEVDQLVAYLQQIDDDIPTPTLPFEPPRPTPSGGAGGQSGTGGAGGSPLSGAAGSPLAPAPPHNPPTSSCDCRLGLAAAAGNRAQPLLMLTSLLGAVVLRRRRLRVSSGQVLALGALLVACSGDPAPSSNDQSSRWSNLPQVTHPEPELQGLGTREATLERVCARGRGDSFATALCGSGQLPEISNLRDLLQLSGLGEERAFALTGNSTSLVSRSVSAINPRIIVFPRVDSQRQRPGGMTAVGFVRGEQFVELASRDSVSGDLNFYLLSFEQPCSYQAQGCDLASLLTEEIEQGWTAYSVYDQDDLEGTSFDCLSCHQPRGHGTPRILRMQELASPWLHWFPQRFVQQTESDRLLTAQFAATHQHDSQYGGISVPVIVDALDDGSGAQLEALLRAEGFAEQPNPFDGQIAKEATETSSPTWQARFDAHLRGEAIAVPYPSVDVTDAAKRDAASLSYLAVVQALAPRETLLDIRDVFSADAAAKLSFVPTAGADGKSVLVQMCSRCHDGRGNPDLSKNHFNVLKLAEMTRATKDLAIARISATGTVRMPPWRSGMLTPESIQAATIELQR